MKLFGRCGFHVALLCGWLVLQGCREAEDSMLPMIGSHHDNDRIEWQIAPNVAGASAAHLVVDSAKGIGQVELQRPQDGWPELMTIELKLDGLEGFFLTANAQRFALSISAEQNVLLDPVTDNPLSLVFAPNEQDSEQGFIVAVTLDSVYAEAPKLALRWVDYYR